MGSNPGRDFLVHKCIFSEISRGYGVSYGVCVLSDVLSREMLVVLTEGKPEG